MEVSDDDVSGGSFDDGGEDDSESEWGDGSNESGRTDWTAPVAAVAAVAALGSSDVIATTVTATGVVAVAAGGAAVEEALGRVDEGLEGTRKRRGLRSDQTEPRGYRDRT